MADKLQIGERLRAARNKAKLSQDAAAEELGVSKTTVSNWERGVMHPRVQELPGIRRAYDVSLDLLICGDERSPALKGLRIAEPPPLPYIGTPKGRTARMTALFDLLPESQQDALLHLVSGMVAPVKSAANSK